MTWPCFLAVPTGRARQELRRWHDDSTRSTCPGPWGYHNISLPIGDILYSDALKERAQQDDFPHDDPRWPAACSCGYRFQDDDPWQYNVYPLFGRTPDDPHACTFRQPIPGAFLDASSLLDGIAARPSDETLTSPTYHGYLSRFYYQQWWGTRAPLYLALPDGTLWCIDSKSTNGEGWQVTGEPPLLTATPSIASTGYHGFLHNGVLTDDLEGRTYP